MKRYANNLLNVSATNRERRLYKKIYSRLFGRQYSPKEHLAGTAPLLLEAGLLVPSSSRQEKRSRKKEEKMLTVGWETMNGKAKVCYPPPYNTEILENNSIIRF